MDIQNLQLFVGEISYCWTKMIVENYSTNHQTFHQMDLVNLVTNLLMIGKSNKKVTYEG